MRVTSASSLCGHLPCVVWRHRLLNRLELQVHLIQAFKNGATETAAGLLHKLRDPAFGPDCPAFTGCREANAVIAFSVKQLPGDAIGH